MSFLDAMKSGRVLAVDPSTNALAFCVIEHSTLLAYGKIKLPVGDWQEKFKVINAIVPFIIKMHRPTHFVCEQSIYIQNPNTSRSLAYINGCILSQALSTGLQNVRDVSPLVWKPGIGYKNVSAKEKAAWTAEHGLKESKKIAASERKARTQRIVDEMIPNHGCTDNDVVDAIGIGIWSVKNVL